MVIQHNIAALNSHRNLGIANGATSKNLEKLSSGYRINRAGDDAAGLAISEKMRAQIRGLEMAEQNSENAISLIQTAEGGLQETHAILQRMRELAVQASNGTYQDEDRLQINNEVDALKAEITRIAESTHYNNIYLLDGSLSEANKSYNTNLYAMTYDSTAPADGTKLITDGKISGLDVQVVYAHMAESLDLAVNISVGLDGTYTLELDTALTGSGTDYSGNLTLTQVSENVWKLELTDAYKANAANTDQFEMLITIDSNMLATNGTAEMRLAINVEEATGPMTNGVTTSTMTAQIWNWNKETVSLSTAAGTNDHRHLTSYMDDIFKIKLENWSPTNANSTGFSTWDATSSQWVPQSLSVNIEFNADGTISYATINGTDADVSADGSVLTFTDDQGNKHLITIDTDLVAELGIATFSSDEFNYTADIHTGKSTISDHSTNANFYGEMTLYDLDRMEELGTNEGLVFQIGANGTEDQRLQMYVNDMSAKALGVDAVDIKTRDAANDAIETINDAINLVSDERSKLGAVQNRLEHTLNNLGVSKENLTAAESTIRDVDMAKEMMEFTKNNILVQASQAMLAQANSLPQGVLSLLR